MAIGNIKLETKIHDRIPFAKWEIVDVEFPTSANVDFVIPHSLSPSDPYDVHYIVLKQVTGGNIYEAQRGLVANAKAWTSDFIVLRSDTASWQGRIMLCTLVVPIPFETLNF